MGSSCCPQRVHSEASKPATAEVLAHGDGLGGSELRDNIPPVLLPSPNPDEPLVLILQTSGVGVGGFTSSEFFELPPSSPPQTIPAAQLVRSTEMETVEEEVRLPTMAHMIPPEEQRQPETQSASCILTKESSSNGVQRDQQQQQLVDDEFSQQQHHGNYAVIMLADFYGFSQAQLEESRHQPTPDLQSLFSAQ